VLGCWLCCATESPVALLHSYSVKRRALWLIKGACQKAWHISKLQNQTIIYGLLSRIRVNLFLSLVTHKTNVPSVVRVRAHIHHHVTNLSYSTRLQHRKFWPVLCVYVINLFLPCHVNRSRTMSVGDVGVAEIKSGYMTAAFKDWIKRGRKVTSGLKIWLQFKNTRWINSVLCQDNLISGWQFIWHHGQQFSVMLERAARVK